jgi:hypothetical protein
MAARLMDVEPNMERWRNIARNSSSHGMGLAEQPGAGKLLHDLRRLLGEVAEKNYEARINCFIKRYGYYFEHGDSVLIGLNFLA